MWTKNSTISLCNHFLPGLSELTDIRLLFYLNQTHHRAPEPMLNSKTIYNVINNAA